jgi:DNA modification methylase
MTVIFHGDARTVLTSIPDRTVQTCVTSPPYFGLRAYLPDGHPDKGYEMGLEPTPDAYVADMVALFREVRRVLRDDGTLWLNLGDSYSRSPLKGGSGPNGKHDTIPDYGAARKHLAENAKIGSSDGAVGRGDRPGFRSGGLAEKQLLGIPWRVAFALQADGWYLRQDLIWHKPNPMPESVTDRCTKAHEYIFLMSKSPRYYFDQQAILEPCSINTHARLSQNVAAQIGSARANGGTRSARPMKAVGKLPGNKSHKFVMEYETGGNGQHRTAAGLVKYAEKIRKMSDGWGVKNNASFDDAMAIMPTHRNPRSVWTVGSKPYKGAHFATFPPDLITPCILAGAPPGGLVLDPFLGSGTTAVVAAKHGRECWGIELNAEYIELAKERLCELDAPVIYRL